MNGTVPRRQADGRVVSREPPDNGMQPDCDLAGLSSLARVASRLRARRVTQGVRLLQVVVSGYGVENE